MRGIFPPNPIFLGSALDEDAARWIAAVGRSNVSAPRGALVSNTIRELKAANVWAALDFLPVLAAENAASALVDWRARKTTTAINGPTFTADRGYAFDGATNYLSTGFIPSSNSVAATGTSFMLGVYERTNVAAPTIAVGAANSATQTMRLTPRSAGSQMLIHVNAAAVSVANSVTDSRGLSTAITDGVNGTGYVNGSVSATSALTTPGSAHTTWRLFIGCYNSAGTPLSFRASTIGYAMYGANAWTATQHLQFYTIMQRFMTALGANV